MRKHAKCLGKDTKQLRGPTLTEVVHNQFDFQLIPVIFRLLKSVYYMANTHSCNSFWQCVQVFS